MPPFAGERFLEVDLPNYDGERLLLSGILFASTIFWIALLPLFCIQTIHVPVEECSSSSNSKQPNQRKSTNKASEKQTMKSISFLPVRATVFSVSGWTISLVYLLLTWNPHNYYNTKRIFQGPLLSGDECNTIQEMAHRAALQNYQAAAALTHDDDNHSNNQNAKTTTTTSTLLEHPQGWQKVRHTAYPTTDLNLVTDPFTAQDRQWLGDVLDRRLAPLVARVYGIPQSSLRANDMFVVRYDVGDGPHMRTQLRSHTDDGDISFNILLNNDFEGGGTRFWNMHERQPFVHVQPITPGSILLHSALIRHEGYPIASGTRFILVGFLSVDRADPWTGANTGLSIFASWWSLPWMHRLVKDASALSFSRLHDQSRQHPGVTATTMTGKWTDSPYVRSLFRDVLRVLEMVQDRIGTHVLEDILPQKDTAKVDAYLAQLDQSYDRGLSERRKGASWWKGQQIDVDIDGTITTWSTRDDKSEAFKDL